MTLIEEQIPTVWGLVDVDESLRRRIERQRLHEKRERHKAVFADEVRWSHDYFRLCTKVAKELINHRGNYRDRWRLEALYEFCAERGHLHVFEAALQAVEKEIHDKLADRDED